LRANTHPFAPGLPEELDRQVRIGIGDDLPEWPRDAMGPIGWTQHAGQRAGAPASGRNSANDPARGQLWLDSVPAMLEAAEQGLGVTLAMAPLIKARPGFGKKLVAAFDIAASPTETIYLGSRTEQARDRRIGALRRWIVDAVNRARQASVRTGRRFE
jgi:LysR family glycine cleavage system transcriptional activator